jgi:hypothetical protein
MTGPRRAEQAASLANITREAVLAAIGKYDEQGQDAFSDKYSNACWPDCRSIAGTGSRPSTSPSPCCGHSPAPAAASPACLLGETQRQVKALFDNYGRDWEGDRVFYPIAALHTAGLWELDADPEQVRAALSRCPKSSERSRSVTR